MRPRTNTIAPSDITPTDAEITEPTHIETATEEPSLQKFRNARAKLKRLINDKFPDQENMPEHEKKFKDALLARIFH